MTCQLLRTWRGKIWNLDVCIARVQHDYKTTPMDETDAQPWSLRSSSTEQNSRANMGAIRRPFSTSRRDTRSTPHSFRHRFPRPLRDPSWPLSFGNMCSYLLEIDIWISMSRRGCPVLLTTRGEQGGTTDGDETARGFRTWKRELVVILTIPWKPACLPGWRANNVATWDGVNRAKRRARHISLRSLSEIS